MCFFKSRRHVCLMVCMFLLPSISSAAFLTSTMISQPFEGNTKSDTPINITETVIHNTVFSKKNYLNNSNLGVQNQSRNLKIKQAQLKNSVRIKNSRLTRINSGILLID